MEGKGASKIALPIVVILVVLAAVLGYMWYTNSQTAQETVEEVQDNVTQTDVLRDDDLLSKVLDNPDQYYGQTVTVAGEIEDVLNHRAFKVSDQTVGDELLVITKRPLSASELEEAEEFFEDNADIKATGEVHRLVVAEIENEFNIDLTEDLEVEFRDKPVLVADSFTFSDGNLVIDFTQGP